GQLDVREGPPDPLLRGRAAEADHEHLPRVRLVGKTELHVVGVGKPGAERVVEVHPALEGAVEAEVAGPLVAAGEEAVVARVARLADGEAACGGEPDLGGVELPRRANLALAVER